MCKLCGKVGQISLHINISRASVGRPPYPTASMARILVLQQLYKLADEALEYQLLDRRSFMQFLELTESSSIPDAKTIWLFRYRLARAGAGTLMFEQGQRQSQQQGYMAYMACCGQIDDAALVQAQAQRNKRARIDDQTGDVHFILLGVVRLNANNRLI